MSKNIVLAVAAAPGGEPGQHVPAAAAMTRELSRDSGDHVTVLHVHEFSVGRYGRIRVDCADGEGERTVDTGRRSSPPAPAAVGGPQRPDVPSPVLGGRGPS